MIDIKVLQIISGNDNGGGGKHVLNICAYSGDKFENVIGAIGKGPLYDNAVNLGVEILAIKNLRDNSICDYINNSSVDIVNFHGAKAFFMHYLLKNKIKKICTATIHSDYRYDFLNDKLKYVVFTPLSKLGLKSFSNHICVSKYIKELLINKGFNSKKTVVNNGIDLEEVKILKSREEIRKIWNIDDNDFVYVMVARMHPIKNHIGCINAFNKLSKKYNDIKLLLVGDGELRDNLKKRCEQLNISDKVIFAGFQSSPLDFVAASDISMLTSFNEGGSPPIVLLESGALKKAAICSDIGDISECIDENTGFLVNPNSIEDIYCKMDKAYKYKGDLQHKGNSLYELIKHRYTMKNFCNQYYNFYKEILLKQKWSEQ